MASAPAFHLSSPLSAIPGIGQEKANALAMELNLFTVEDLIFHIPFKYIDKSTYYTIQQLNEDMPHVQVVGKIIQMKLEGGGKGRRFVAIFEDNTGQAKLVWFKGILYLVNQASFWGKSILLIPKWNCIILQNSKKRINGFLFIQVPKSSKRMD
jgi:RecG-like helicase